jgi:hypothetical protein
MFFALPDNLREITKRMGNLQKVCRAMTKELMNEAKDAAIDLRASGEAIDVLIYMCDLFLGMFRTYALPHRINPTEVTVGHMKKFLERFFSDERWIQVMAEPIAEKCSAVLKFARDTGIFTLNFIPKAEMYNVNCKEVTPIAMKKCAIKMVGEIRAWTEVRAPPPPLSQESRASQDSKMSQKHELDEDVEDDEIVIRDNSKTSRTIDTLCHALNLGGDIDFSKFSQRISRSQ